MNTEKHYQTMRAHLGHFTELTEEAWVDCALLFSALELPKDGFFVRAGEQAKNIAFVAEGALREYYITREGNEYNKAFVLPGFFTGSLFDLLSGEPSTANIQALKNAKLLVAPYAEYAKLYEKHHCFEKLARRATEMLFMKKARREYEFLTLDARGRYLNLMKDYPDLDKYAAQYHIASYLGITPEALSRLKKKL